MIGHLPAISHCKRKRLSHLPGTLLPGELNLPGHLDSELRPVLAH